MAVIIADNGCEGDVECGPVKALLGGWRGSGWPILDVAGLVDPSLGVYYHVGEPQAVASYFLVNIAVSVEGCRGQNIRESNVLFVLFG